jgi:membrane-associated phospholipid phosphatase
LNGRLLSVGVALAAAALVVAIYVAAHPFIPQDAALEDGVQSTRWGPLLLAFPVFSWIGDAKGLLLEAIIFVAVLGFNRRAWLIPIAASMSGGWYFMVSHMVLRPRPTTAQVLQVTEHPGASSFPSGHTIFIVTVMAVLMLCFGYRYLRGWGRIAGWVVVGAVIVANGIGRIYTGAHWPTDVIEGGLIGGAWMCLVMSLPQVAGAVTTLRVPASPSDRPGRARREASWRREMPPTE